MTNLRWKLGGALTALSVVAAVRALALYVSHHLWLGSLSVVMLVAIAIGGFWTLWQARRRIGRELAALSSDLPGGELWSTRRGQLERIRASGAQPDREALAAAAEAEERGRAYVGRYLVAVTVLVGLVGTFAGLMETLRTVAPLVKDDTAGALQLIAGPLAGLDVTFGASVVGILVTLALALVQGDLVLAEELALARLEERTTHVLMPTMWPQAESPLERSARELQSLRGDMEAVLVRAGERAAERVAQVTGAAVAELSRQVASALEKTVNTRVQAEDKALARFDEGISRLIGGVEKTGSEAMLAATAAVGEVQKTAQAVLAQQGGATERLRAIETRLEQATAQLRATGETSVVETARRLDELAVKQAAAFERSADTAARALNGAGEKTMTALDATVERAAAALQSTTARATQALEATTTQTTMALDGTVQRATTALVEATAAAAGALDLSAQQTTTALVEATAAAAGALEVTAERATTTLSETATAATGALVEMTRTTTEAMSESTEALNRALTDSTAAATGLLDGLARSTSDALADVTLSTKGALEAMGERATTVLLEAAQLATDAAAKANAGLDTASERASEVIAGAAASAVDALAGADAQTRAQLVVITDRVSAALEAVVAKTGDHFAAPAERATAALLAATERTTQTLTTAAEQTLAALEAVVAKTGDHFAAPAERATEALQAATERTTQALTAAAEQAIAALQVTAELTAETLARTASEAHEKLAGTAEAATLALAASGQGVSEALQATVGETGSRVETAAGTLAEAANGLREASAGLLPQLATLGPELAALAREVALLSVRADREVEPLLAEEMVRLGDGVARLEQLMEMSRVKKGRRVEESA